MTPIAAAYLGSHFLSLLGNGIAAVALPLVVLQVTGSPSSMGVIAAATAVPAVVIGLIAGVVIDRFDRRNISVVADLISAASIAALPLVDAVWGLQLWWFVALGVVGAFGDVPGGTAREVLVAAVVRRSGVPLERLAGLRQTLTSSAFVLGPALAGTLVALLGPTAVFLVTAGTSAAAALLTLLIPTDLGRVPRSQAAPESPWRQVVGGVLVLRQSRFLVAIIVLIVGLTTVGGGLQGLVLPLHFASIGRPEALGLVLTVMAVGMLAGAAVFSVLGPRVPRRVWLGIGFTCLTAGFLALSTLASLPVVFGAALCIGLSNAMLGGVLGVLQIERTPDHARGRVLALQNTALQLAAPLGIGGAGLVAESAGAAAAGFAVCGVWVLALVVVLATRSLRDLEHAGAVRRA